MSDFALNNKTVRVDALSHDGRGIAVIDGKKSFLAGVLPNETVQYQLHRKHAHYNEGVGTAILEASPERVSPRCAHFGVCGGCSVQYMSERLQVEYKQNTLIEQLQHFGKVSPHRVLEPISGENWGYRKKARLGVKFVTKKNKLLVGFREKSHRYLTDASHCLTLDPRVGEHFSELSGLISSLSIYQHIPQVEISMGDDSGALIFRCMKPLENTDRDKLIQFGKMHEFDVYVEPNAPAPLEQLYAHTNRSFRLSYALPDFNVEFLFHPKDFTQVNSAVNRRMVSLAIELLDLNAEDVVLDLFSGIGNFTLPIARRAKQVVGVEGSAEMVLRGIENSRHNHIKNTEFFAANLEETVSSEWRTRSYTKVLLDPPRAGAKEVLPLLQNKSITRVVYVSCNPATLARDAGILVHDYGYALAACGVLNMFPHTAHVESIALFERHE